MKKRASFQAGSTTLGVMGTGPGTGVTHFSIMLAGYIGSKLRKKVALVELNRSRDFEEIQKAYEGCSDEARRFRILDTVYYRSSSGEELTDILNEGYEYVVLDLGWEFSKNETEFLRSSKKIIVGSLCEWKRGRYVKFVEEHKGEDGRWEYLSMPAMPGEIRDMRYSCGIKIRSIPFEPDPFLIRSQNFGFFHQLI